MPVARHPSPAPCPRRVRRSPPRMPLAMTLAVLLAVLATTGLAACSSERAAPEPSEPRPVELAGRVPLYLELPPQYELQVEIGPTFDIYHVWRVPPRPVDKDTSLGILVGQPITAYCRPSWGEYRPAAFPAWRLRWHVCGEEGTRSRVWETHVRGATREPLHIFIIGPDRGETERLRAIAETLRPR